MPSNSQRATERPEFAALLREYRQAARTARPFIRAPRGALQLHARVDSSDLDVWLLPGPLDGARAPLLIVEKGACVAVGKGWQTNVLCALLHVAGRFVSDEEIRASVGDRLALDAEKKTPRPGGR